MHKLSHLFNILLKPFGLLIVLLLLSQCDIETQANFPEQVETIVSKEAMGEAGWGLSPGGTKLYYRSAEADKDYPNILLYLETGETYYLDRRRCDGSPYWLDDRLLACNLHSGEFADVFDTEQRRFLAVNRVKRSEVDLEALLLEAEQIYYLPSRTLVLLDDDPYAAETKNYIIGGHTTDDFEASLADYSHISLPIYPEVVEGKVFSPDEAYYYTITDGEAAGLATHTLTIYRTEDDQEITSVTTERLRDAAYIFFEVGWAWDSSGVYFSISNILRTNYSAIHKLKVES